MARRPRGRRGPMVSPPMMEPPMPSGPVEQAVQGMPYSYKGVTAQDIMQYLGEISQLTPEQMAVADVNQDGTVDTLDVSWINQMAEGLRDPNTLEGITQPAPQPPAPPIPVGSPMGAGGPSGPRPPKPMMPPGPPPMMPPGEPMMQPPMMPPGPPPMMQPPMMPPGEPVPPPMPPAPASPVDEAVQQMPYSYRGLTADDILQHVVGIKELTPEQLAIADLNQSGDITPGDALWIKQMESGLRDPNTLETIEQPAQPMPQPPPMMPPPPMMSPEPKFPGQEPKFPGVPPIQIPEPVGPIAMPPAPPTVPPPPVGGGGGGGRGGGPRGGGPTPEQQAQLQIDQEEWSTNPRRFIAEPYWLAPNWCGK